jgi:ribonuclease-3
MTLTSFSLRTNSSPQVLAWAKAHPHASFAQLARWVGKRLGWFKEVQAIFPLEFGAVLAPPLGAATRRAAINAWYLATVEALCHSSFQHEFVERAWPNNERLEFLGDSVLQILLSEILYRAYPTAREGDLSHWRAAAVNAQVWGRLALLLKLDQFLLVGKGMATKISLNMLADAWEALWAVAYLHLSKAAFQQAFAAVLQRFTKVYGVDFLTYATTYVDTKSRLQEVLMQQKMPAPVYKCQVLPDQQVRVEMWIGQECQAVTAASRRQGEAWLAAQVLPRFLQNLAQTKRPVSDPLAGKGKKAQDAAALRDRNKAKNRKEKVKKYQSKKEKIKAGKTSPSVR